MLKKSNLRRVSIGLIMVGLTAIAAFAQSTAFTYQGKLSVSGNPATGNYEMRFTLEDVDGFALGTPVTIPSVTVSQGIFTVQLDFGSTYFDASDRFLKIEIRQAGDPNPPPFTTLAPRQQITSAPKALFSNSSAFAVFSGSSTNAQQLGGLTADNFIQNTTTQQTANFNISGSGIVGGNFGVGTTTPRAKFHVVGSSWFQGDSTPLPAAAGKGIVVGFGGEQGYIQAFDYAAFTGKNLLLNNSGGNVGIGTAAPTSKLHVVGNTFTSGFLDVGTGARVIGGLNIFNGLALNSGNLSVSDSATISGNLNVSTTTISSNATINGNLGVGNGVTISNGLRVNTGGISFVLTSGTFDQDICRNIFTGFLGQCGSSSLRYKSDVQTFGGGLSVVNRLRPVAFNWKHTGRRDVGFVAEEVFQIEPLLTTLSEAGEIEGVKYKQLSVVFVNAINEQQAQIEQQKQQIERQQQQIDALTRFICLQNPKAEICREQ